jgi:uncharacterized protein YaaQ
MGNGIAIHMKFVIAIVQDYDCDRLLRAITEKGLRATKISSTGGFLRMGNATVFICVEDARVPETIDLIRQNCESRVEVQLDATSPEYVEWFPAGMHEVTVGGAVVFILPVARMVQLRPEGDEEL